VVLVLNKNPIFRRKLATIAQIKDQNIGFEQKSHFPPKMCKI
jgi:hypothetical protein